MLGISVCRQVRSHGTKGLPPLLTMNRCLLLNRLNTPTERLQMPRQSLLQTTAQSIGQIVARMQHGIARTLQNLAPSC